MSCKADSEKRRNELSSLGSSDVATAAAVSALERLLKAVTELDAEGRRPLSGRATRRRVGGQRQGEETRVVNGGDKGDKDENDDEARTDEHGGGGDDGPALPSLSHWRVMPPDVSAAYAMLDDGSERVRAASTKYALLAQVEHSASGSPSGSASGSPGLPASGSPGLPASGSPGLPASGSPRLSASGECLLELLTGCDAAASAATILLDPALGCGRPCRVHARSACRSIVCSVLALVRAFADGSALHGSGGGGKATRKKKAKRKTTTTTTKTTGRAGEDHVGARLTGAVWSACDASAAGRMPRGNRACVRREMLAHVSDCNETAREFEELLLLEAASAEAAAGAGAGAGPGPSAGPNGEAEAGAGALGWDEFCGRSGTGEAYAAPERPVVRSCLALVKCSRGTVKSALEACDALGALADDARAAARHQHASDLLRHLQHLVDASRAVGHGVTELGALLYPPIDTAVSHSDGVASNCGGRSDVLLDAAESQLERAVKAQRDAILHAHQILLLASDASATATTVSNVATATAALDLQHGAPLLPESLVNACAKIRTATTLRSDEALNAIRNLKAATSNGIANDSTTSVDC